MYKYFVSFSGCVRGRYPPSPLESLLLPCSPTDIPASALGATWKNFRSVPFCPCPLASPQLHHPELGLAPQPPITSPRSLLETATWYCSHDLTSSRSVTPSVIKTIGIITNAPTFNIHLLLPISPRAPLNSPLETTLGMRENGVFAVSPDAG